MKKIISCLLVLVMTMSLCSAAMMNVSAATPSIKVSPSTLNITVGQTGTVTWTTVPANQLVYISPVSLSHTNYSQSDGKMTFTGRSVGTDQVYAVMSYNGKEYYALVTVNVTEKTLSSIAVTTKPTKTSYYVGDTLNTAGMVVQATYSDGSKANVTGYTCSPTTLSTAGTQTVTVTYKEGTVTKTTTFTVSVTAPSITVSPATLNITVGQTGAISFTTVPAGQTVGMSNMNVSHTSFSKDNSKVTFTGNSVGTDSMDLTMTYGGKTYSAHITVKVTDRTLSSIAVMTKPTKLTYHVGDTLDTTGMVVQATYTNGSKANVTGWTCSPTTLKTKGTQTITVTYKEGTVTKTATFTVYVDDLFTCTLTLSKTSMNFKKGKSDTVNCTYTLSGDYSSLRSISIDCQISPNIANYEFGEWQSSNPAQNTIPLTLYGTTPGTATVTVTITETDTGKVLATAEPLSLIVGPPDPLVCTLALSKTSLSFSKAGQSETINCAYTITGDYSNIKSVNIGYLTGYDSSIASISFGNWTGSAFDQNSRSATITALSSGSTDIVFVLYDGETEEIYAQQTLTVTVGDRTPGDVNGDGKVNLVDAALISRYVVGGWGVTLNASNADVNADGKVNLIDAALISRYVVGGWGVVLK